MTKPDSIRFKGKAANEVFKAFMTESPALVRYCQQHAWLADQDGCDVIGRGHFANMECSQCGYVRPIVVFALKRELICEWTDGEDGPCETACGHSMDFEYDGPKENQFKFCPYCGLGLVIKQASK